MSAELEDGEGDGSRGGVPSRGLPGEDLPSPARQDGRWAHGPVSSLPSDVHLPNAPASLRAPPEAGFLGARSPVQCPFTGTRHDTLQPYAFTPT